MSLNLNHIFKAQKWISFFLDPEKKKLVYITVIKLYFSFCLVICTFSFGKVSKLINRIPRKTLGTVYDDLMMWEVHFKRFYNQVSVFTICNLQISPKK